ncbi:chitin disaccharide deacetylase [Enterobacter sp. RHBSTW-00994]|uniref:chitin disaccharide deacetylase n=1 Tax=Enterobacteriaceae TaxID=543 RepID=UPI0015EACFE6|nr:MULTISPECIES: chitin disaccharide deacetylase [Enterobacteriaceae]MBM3070794.1 chitin disaccharide deacetylase [Lelliottia sp. RWM.1]QLR42859.1 chitin disaccharide deacetylase [Enterobacter sp. RHBSTW-00994]
MENLLIVNADDFGLSKGQNYGIVEACRHGVVTSTTALINGEAVEHAALLSRELPELGVGLHFVLTLGMPLSPMPGLARDGLLGKWIWEMAEQGALPLDEMTRELDCQFNRFVDVFGREPTHIDSHHHVHMIPALFPLVAEFAQRKGVSLRVDRQALQEALLPSVVTTDGFSSGFYGDEISESLFLQVLDDSSQRGERSVEVMAHPAFVDNTVRKSAYCWPRLAELDVLTSSSLKYAIAERGYRLGTFRDL